MSPENKNAAGRTIEIMERQLGQLVRLIDDLLDVSRITTGKLSLKLEVVTLQQVITGAVDLVQPTASERAQKVLLTFPGEPIQLHADPTRLTQIFSNLLNNALKFSPTDKPVRLTVERADTWVTVAVEDEGIGIPEALLSQVFEPFFQISGGQLGENSGLGIGLTLVKRFVELHGGSVEANSAGSGLGTKIEVRLPIVPLEPSKSSATVLDIVKTGSARRILVADDNRDAAQSLGELLSLMGHEVALAYDGRQAVEMAQHVRPHLTILDIGMPNMNGYECCREIKERAPDAVVIALTGWGQDTDRLRSAAAGFAGHLVKPVEIQVLTSIIEDLGRAAPDSLTH
jgi:CheY-like chemotaxis protein/two-component sensor histidine kinase